MRHRRGMSERESTRELRDSGGDQVASMGASPARGHIPPMQSPYRDRFEAGRVLAQRLRRTNDLLASVGMLSEWLKGSLV